MIPESLIDLLAWDTRSVAHVATMGPEGEPQSSPVWFDWDGTHIVFSQLTKRQKYKNLMRDPRVSLSIEDPANYYRYLEVRGVVEDVELDVGSRFLDRLTKKYTGQDEFGAKGPDDERMTIKIRPLKASGQG